MGDVAIEEEAEALDDPFDFSWMNPPNEPLAPTRSLIVDLPSENRIHIWNYLRPSDHKSLRLVCKRFLYDVDQRVGVHAILSGGQPWSELSLFSKLQVFVGIGPEADTWLKSQSWIENVLVRSLTVRDLAQITIFDKAPILKQKRLLLNLSIELDEAAKEPVIEMLLMYNHLTSLTVTGGITCGLRALDDLREYNRFSKTLLECLTKKDDLKELTFQLNFIFDLRRPDGSVLIGSPLVGDDPGKVWNSTYPTWRLRLRKLDISMLALGPEPIFWWKRFLESQDQLIELKLSQGFFIPWKFYQTVLQQNSTTLRHLELVLPQVGVVPEDRWFNWNVLNPMSSTLKSLQINMERNPSPYLKTPEFIRGVACDTLNLGTLELHNLKKLELRCIYLFPAQLDKIFTGFPSLKDVSLKYWTRTGENPELDLAEDDEVDVVPEPEDYIERNTHLYNLLTVVLSQKRFEKIVLSDPSLSSSSRDVEDSVFRPACAIPGTLFRGVVRPGYLEMIIINILTQTCSDSNIE